MSCRRIVPAEQAFNSPLGVKGSEHITCAADGEWQT
jgi:hypothetical protein